MTLTSTLALLFGIFIGVVGYKARVEAAEKEPT